MKRIHLIAAIFAYALSGILLSASVITNHDIIRMSDSGLDESIIKRAIHASEVDFDLSPDGLSELSEANVPNAVILEMFNAVEKNGDPTPPPPSPPGPGTGIPEKPGYLSNLGEGEYQINAGIGVSGWGIPIYVGVDYGIHEDITIGPRFSYRRYSPGWGNLTIYEFTFSGNYHFNRLLDLPREWDLYAGASAHYYHFSNDHYTWTYSSGLFLGLHVGGRYFFTDNYAINVQVGGGTGTGGGLVGITYRF